MYTVHFEITNQSGSLFSHSEEFRIAGLARVRVREKKSERFTDWSGSVRRYTAKSSRPFAVTILSNHWSENQDGSNIDLSKVTILTSTDVRVVLPQQAQAV
jgi:hypothetical protein